MSTRADISEADDGATASASAGARWQFGSFELNEKRMELRRAGELVRIETKPLNLLMLFVRNPGALITKNDLVDALWPNGIANDAMLGSCVAKLRSALGEDGGTLVRNVFGHGYRFDGEPRRLAEPAAVAPPSLDLKAGDAPPMRPNWRLVRRLGLSGDSWLAEHVKSRGRRVFKFSNDTAGLSALKREVTIFRLLRESLGDRLCYVDLLDWNFDTAPWFIEAEYCPAGSLQEWCIAQGGAEHVPFATRLDLVIQIAEALAAVHAVGVLHKDLKPANVFIVIGEDGRPNARLADFGASSLHDSVFLQRLEITRAGFTQMLDSGAGARAGTLLYLAPEVAAGQPATVRADIYALGLILYQLVTGALGRQLSSGWEAEVGDEMLREDIAAATAGDPDRRLADAGELARRLRSLDERRRAVADARAAAEAAERAVRRAERARARRAGLIAAFAALAMGLVGATVFALRANDARKHAEFETARARTVGEFLAGGMFSNISDDVRQVRDMPIKELLDRAAARIPDQYASDPDTKRDLHLALASAFQSLDYMREMDRQLASADTLIVERNGVGDERRLAIAARRIVASHVAGRLRDEVDRFEQVTQQAIPVTDDGKRAARDLQRELVRARLFLGQSDLAKRKAQQLLADVNPADAEDHIDSLRLLGLAQMKLLEVRDARTVFKQALDLRRRVSGEGSRRLIPLLCNIAFVSLDTGDLDEAEAYLIEARTIAAEWLHESAGWRDTVEAGFAMLAHHRGDSEEATRRLRAVISRASLDAPDNSVGSSAEYVAMLICVLNDSHVHDEAKQLLDSVLPYLRSTLALGSVDLLRLQLEYVRALLGTRETEVGSEEAIKLRESLIVLLPMTHPLIDLVQIVYPQSQTTLNISWDRLKPLLHETHPLLSSISKQILVAR